MITQHHDDTANSFHSKDINLFFLLCTGSQNQGNTVAIVLT